MRQLIYKIFEKNGQVKLISAILLALIFMIINHRIGYRYDIWWVLAIIPGTYVLLFFLVGLVHAAIINPLKDRKKKLDK